MHINLIAAKYEKRKYCIQCIRKKVNCKEYSQRKQGSLKMLEGKRKTEWFGGNIIWEADKGATKKISRFENTPLFFIKKEPYMHIPEGVW